MCYVNAIVESLFLIFFVFSFLNCQCVGLLACLSVCPYSR